MYKVNEKRRILVLKDLCLRAGLKPGDAVGIFEHDGQITILKKQKGVSAGCLRHLNSSSALSDEESLMD